MPVHHTEISEKEIIGNILDVTLIKQCAIAMYMC